MGNCPTLGIWHGCSEWERLQDRVEGYFNLEVDSKTDHQFFANVSLTIYNNGLENLLILQRIGEAPISHRIDPNSWPSWYITFEQYFNVGWLRWWKIDIGGRTLVLVFKIN